MWQGYYTSSYKEMQRKYLFYLFLLLFSLTTTVRAHNDGLKMTDKKTVNKQSSENKTLLKTSDISHNFIDNDLSDNYNLLSSDRHVKLRDGIYFKIKDFVKDENNFHINSTRNVNKFKKARNPVQKAAIDKFFTHKTENEKRRLDNKVLKRQHSQENPRRSLILNDNRSATDHVTSEVTSGVMAESVNKHGGRFVYIPQNKSNSARHSSVGDFKGSRHFLPKVNSTIKRNKIRRRAVISSSTFQSSLSTDYLGESSSIPAYYRRLPTGIHFPVNFKTAAAHLIVRYTLYSLFSIVFQLRTTQSEGLLMYSGGMTAGLGKDLMVIEIVNGHVRFIYDLGAGPRVLRDNRRYPINDNRWHEVGVVRPTINEHMLIVDDSVISDKLPEDSRSVYFDTGEKLYVGGMPPHFHQTLPKQVRSRAGYRGCLASLELSRERINPLESSYGTLPGLRSPSGQSAGTQPRFHEDLGQPGGSVIGGGFPMNPEVDKGIGNIPEEFRDEIESGCPRGQHVLWDCSGEGSPVHRSGAGGSLGGSGGTGPSGEGQCMNGGTCVRQSRDNSWCSCDMTSYTGPDCSHDSVTYMFGMDVSTSDTAGQPGSGMNYPSSWDTSSESVDGPDHAYSTELTEEGMSGDSYIRGGVITLTIPENEWQDTSRDLLALGLITNQTSAVICRIESGSSRDFIEMELVDGSVLVVYNMGLMDHPIGALFDKVNDGRYHVIRFTRDGPNSTIQVDDQPIQPKHPAGQQLDVFNHLSKIYVGGRPSQTPGRVDKPLQGFVSGFSFNGLRVLDLASEGDERVKIEGRVRRHTLYRPALTTAPHPQSTTTPPTEPSRTTAEKHGENYGMSTSAAKQSEKQEKEKAPQYGEDQEKGTTKEKTGDFWYDKGDKSKPGKHGKEGKSNGKIKCRPGESGCEKESGRKTEGKPGALKYPAENKNDKDKIVTKKTPASRQRSTQKSIDTYFWETRTPPSIDKSRLQSKPCLDTDDEDCDNDIYSGQSPSSIQIFESINSQSNPTSVSTDQSTTTSQQIPVRGGEDDVFSIGEKPDSEEIPYDSPDKIESIKGIYAVDKEPTGERMPIPVKDSSFLGMNVALIVGIAGGVIILLLVITYAGLRYRSRGMSLAQKINSNQSRGASGGLAGRQPPDGPDGEATRAMLPRGAGEGYTATFSRPPEPQGQGSLVNGQNGTNSSNGSCRRKKKEVKEWYV